MTIVAENWAVFFHVNSIFSTIKMSSYRVLLTLFLFDVLLVFLKFVYWNMNTWYRSEFIYL